jgi:hypothetical protein
VANQIVRREGSAFMLLPERVGVRELVALGLRLPSPTEVIRVVLRANEAVEFACLDASGFVVGERGASTEHAVGLLDATLDDIRRDRTDAVPVVLRFETGELIRILRSAVGLRTRVAMAEVVKGSVRRMGPLPTGASPTGTGDHR